MLQYILKRILIMIPTLLIISFIAFWIIQLPPGDYLTSYIAEMEEQGDIVDPEIIENLRIEYGLDQPFHVQYWKWISGIIFRGDFGYSFENKMKVTVLIKERLYLTIIVSLFSMLFTYAVAIPIGIYSATHQYSIGDYIATFIGFIGLATPNFLLALVLMYLFFIVSGTSLVGLFSPEFIDAAWSLAKFRDMMSHMLIPVIVIGTSGTCSLLRVMRSQLLDELQKQYVITARSKGVDEIKLLWKYPVRASLNPIVSTIGWSLTGIFSGSTITAIVLNLPTQGPVMYRALKSQDMYLAGGFLFILAILTVVGTLISDILLAWLDPRIRLERGV
ncbi:MAG: ABC transporter permease [Spirochaetes bacterium]|nr:ABC transporter permease [Spirochaetota bacterium]